MNYGVVLRVLGIILVIESILMMPPYVIALYFKEGDEFSFLITIILTLTLGIFFATRNKGITRFNPRDGLAIVTFSWIMISLFGSLPLYLSNSTDTLVDAFFEVVSGFTTTGATILASVESLPRGILFWRSFTQWIGGMGILVFTLAILPTLRISGFQLFKAESPGPVSGKIVPRLRDTAKILYITYFTITILQVVFLLFGGMGIYESFIYTFGTVGTGGFAMNSNGMEVYNSTNIYIVIGLFMILSGINFSLYYAAFKGKTKDIFKDEELKLYLILIIGSIVLIALNLVVTNYNNIIMAIRDAFFHVSSMVTTTGFSIVDIDQWPGFSKGVLVILMLIGGNAGSTAGGIKIIRVLVVLKLIKREVGKLFHPRAIMPIKINGKLMPNEKIASINSFLSLYVVVFVVSILIISLEDTDLLTASISVLSTFGNMGIELSGQMRNFGEFSQITKLLFSFLMLLGRLELFTVIALFAPRTWRKRA